MYAFGRPRRVKIFYARSNSSFDSILPGFPALVAFLKALDLELLDILVCRIVVFRDTVVRRGGEVTISLVCFGFEKKAPIAPETPV